MESIAPPLRRKSGRPLSFDRDAALEKAMMVFWRHGYEAASLTELTRAMGVTPPSIYAAYGDKKGLFRQAVQRYLARPRTPAELIAAAPTALEAARTMIEGAAVAFTGTDTPPGCLLASSAIACSAEAADVRDELSAIRRGVEAALRDKIEAGIETGELARDTDAGTLAAYTTTIIQGMSTLARDGAPRAALMKVAAMALMVWRSALSRH